MNWTPALRRKLRKWAKLDKEASKYRQTIQELTRCEDRALRSDYRKWRGDALADRQALEAEIGRLLEKENAP